MYVRQQLCFHHDEVSVASIRLRLHFSVGLPTTPNAQLSTSL